MRDRNKLAVIIDADALIVCICSLGCIRKLLFALIREGKFDNNIPAVHAVRLITSLCIRDIGSAEYCVAGLDDFVERTCQFILAGARIIGIVGVSVVIRLTDEIKRSRLAKLLENRIGIGDAGDFDRDPVFTLFIDLCLRTVLFNTSLQLIDGIVHIFRGRLLIADCLVGDADTASQIESKLHVMNRAFLKFADTEQGKIAGCKENGDHYNHSDPCLESLVFLHFQTSLQDLETPPADPP